MNVKVAIILILLGTAITISVVNVNQIGVSNNYLVEVEVDNRLPFGATIHDAHAYAYDEDGRLIAEAWLVDKDVEIEGSSKQTLKAHVQLLVSEEELGELEGKIRVETVIVFSSLLPNVEYRHVETLEAEELKAKIGG